MEADSEREPSLFGRTLLQSVTTSGRDVTSIDRLMRLGDLEPDWDSYGAEPISAAAIARASDLVRAVEARFEDGAAAPTGIAPMANGGVQITWREAHGDLEVEVSASGEISLLEARPGSAGERYEEADDVSVDEVIHRLERLRGSRRTQSP
jgi:hypothetical protein